jgi:hypothetical protein
MPQISELERRAVALAARPAPVHPDPRGGAAGDRPETVVSLHREPGGCCLPPGRDGLAHGLVDAEDLRQPGNPEDIQDPLLGAS